jgi:hypothetical protein
MPKPLPLPDLQAGWKGIDRKPDKWPVLQERWLRRLCVPAGRIYVCHARDNTREAPEHAR